MPTTPLVLGHHRNVALLAGELVANRLRARPGLRLSFAPEIHGPWLRQLVAELGGVRSMRSHRRRAMVAMRLPPEPALAAQGGPP